MRESLHVVCARCEAINRLPRARLVDQPLCGSCQRPLFDGHPFTLNDSNIQRHLEREYIGGFEPDHEVPASAPLRRPKQPGQRRPKHSGGGIGDGQHTARGRGSEGHKRPRRRRKPRAGSAGKRA